MCLVFSNRQMSEFMANIKTKGGNQIVCSASADTPKEVTNPWQPIWYAYRLLVASVRRRSLRCEICARFFA